MVFAPEVAWVTAGGTEPLTERLAIRPTSETVFSDFYKDDVHSYRDLPRLYNQWCSVVRWEKETRPFLRSREFLWQEGHTIHATKEEAEERTQMMLRVYADFLAEDMAIPTIKGQKTEKEKFAGAESTYTVEALMHDGRALQSGTSHFFGQKFSKAYDITYTDKDNTLKYVWQTSWGLTTRTIGAMIMVHGDNSGLVIPPHIAPVQCAIIPIQQRKEGVLEKANEIKDVLSGFRVKVDDTDKSPGYKFAEQEMRGIPLRIEIGPRDISVGKCVLVRRDTGEKIEAPLDGIEKKVGEVLDAMQQEMLVRAEEHMNSLTSVAEDYDEFRAHFDKGNGFVKAMWCGDRECEDKIKEDLGVTSRCIPFDQEEISGKCVCCGRPAKKMVIWARAY
jgi:prolyl-tRNA synthetase